jgi:hypothetical protein
MSNSSSLRVVAVGQASPRWKGAKDSAEADRNNWNLARQRADNTRFQIEAQLRQKLPGVDIKPGVSHVAPGDGVEVGSYGVGSTESLKRVNGDRTSNEQVDRSVKITIERVTTEQGSAAVTIPEPEEETAVKSWEVTITRYYVDTAGVAMGYVRFKLRKWSNGQTMEGEAFLYGGGLNTDVTSIGEALTKAVKNRLKTAARDLFGREAHSFSTDRDMTFHDFDGRFVTMGKADAKVIVGVGALYMAFRGLGSDAVIPIEKGVTFGLPGAEAYVVTGIIHMIGPYPDNGSTVVVPTETQKSSGDSIVINFPTEDATVSARERLKIEGFMATWTANFKAA